MLGDGLPAEDGLAESGDGGGGSSGRGRCWLAGWVVVVVSLSAQSASRWLRSRPPARSQHWRALAGPLGPGAASRPPVFLEHSTQCTPSLGVPRGIMQTERDSGRARSHRRRMSLAAGLHHPRSLPRSCGPLAPCPRATSTPLALVDGMNGRPEPTSDANEKSSTQAAVSAGGEGGGGATTSPPGVWLCAFAG